jgi:hypothetical protein
LHAVSEIGVLDLVLRSDPCTSVLNGSASVNATSFSVGETAAGGIGLLNIGAQGAADIYAGILLPDFHTVAFFTSTTDVALGDLADLASFRPIATGVPLAEPFAATVPSFFSHQWDGSEPRGDYLLFVLALQSGAAANGSITDEEILAVALRGFSFP